MSNDRTTLEYRKECVQRELSYVNYMRMLSVGCATTWTKYVSWTQRTMSCSGRGSLEEHDEQAIRTRKRGEENEDECKIVKARCAMLVNMNARSYDFER